MPLCDTLRSAVWTRESGIVVRAMAAELQLRDERSLGDADGLNSLVSSAVEQLRRTVMHDYQSTKAVQTGLVPALIELAALNTNTSILAECVRCLSTLSTLPGIQEELSKSASMPEFRQLFSNLGASMSKERSIAQATVSAVRAFSCSPECMTVLVREEGGVDLLCRCVQFWRDDSIAAETCAAMKQLLEGDRPEADCVSEQGGVAMLMNMLRQETDDVVGSACDALGAVVSRGLGLEEVGGLPMILTSIRKLLTRRRIGGSHQKHAMKLLFKLSEKTSAFRKEILASGILDIALEQCTEDVLSRPASVMLCKALKAVGQEQRIPEEFKNVEDCDDNALKIRRALEHRKQQLLDLKQMYTNKSSKTQPCDEVPESLRLKKRSSSTRTKKYPCLFNDENPLARSTISWGAVHHTKRCPEGLEPLAAVNPELRGEYVKQDKELAEHPSDFEAKTVYSRGDVDPPRTGFIPQPRFGPRKGDDLLVFSSEFESGNLESAIQVGELEYDLTVTNDYNTNGHTQWYYFAISNAKKGCEYRFNIINFEKPGSLYNEGMQPLMYSTELATESQDTVGWRHTGSKIAYYASRLTRANGAPYYKLTFCITIETSKTDAIYFANSVPYTFRDLRADLVELRDDPERSKFWQWHSLIPTLGGVKTDMLVVQEVDDSTPPVESRSLLVFSARVHPGETNSSWMMRGMLYWLTDPNNPRAAALRRGFRIVVIPMLNPDGVILGNYRCSMAGLDLNRQWHKPNKSVTPTVHALKQFLRLNQERLACFFDLHGHSRKFESFLYGCKNTHKQERMLPWLLAQREPYFSNAGTSYKVSRSKQGTGRVVGWKEFGLVNCFTLEASFAGSLTGEFPHHWRTVDLERIGASLCEACQDWANVQVCSQKTNELMATILSQRKFRAGGISETSDCLSESGAESDSGSSAGSDAEPCSGNLAAADLQKRWAVLLSDKPADTPALSNDLQKNSRAKTRPRSKSSNSHRAETPPGFRPTSAKPLVRSPPPKPKRAVRQHTRWRPSSANVSQVLKQNQEKPTPQQAASNTSSASNHAPPNIRPSSQQDIRPLLFQFAVKKPKAGKKRVVPVPMVDTPLVKEPQDNEPQAQQAHQHLGFQGLTSVQAKIQYEMRQAQSKGWRGRHSSEEPSKRPPALPSYILAQPPSGTSSRQNETPKQSSQGPFGPESQQLWDTIMDAIPEPPTNSALFPTRILGGASSRLPQVQVETQSRVNIECVPRNKSRLGTRTIVLSSPFQHCDNRQADAEVAAANGEGNEETPMRRIKSAAGSGLQAAQVAAAVQAAKRMGPTPEARPVVRIGNGEGSLLSKFLA